MSDPESVRLVGPQRRAYMIGVWVPRPGATRAIQGYVVEESGCWTWTGKRAKRGYGQFERAKHAISAHRWYFEQANGPIPAGLVLDHICRNTSCVNPDHLRVVTSKENILFGVSPSAINARKTHCIHGHALTPENTERLLRPDGRWRRRCATCKRTWEQNRIHKKRNRKRQGDVTR